MVPNDLLSVRALTPVTRFSLRLVTTTGSPVKGDPISTTAFLQGPEVERAASTSTKRRGVTQHRTISVYASLRTAPSGRTPLSGKRHRAMSHLASHRHHPDPPQALASAIKALSQPATHGTFRLRSYPTPCQLRAHPAHVPVARLGDARFRTIRRCDTALAFSPLNRPPRDASSTRASQTMPFLNNHDPLIPMPFSGIN